MNLGLRKLPNLQLIDGAARSPHLRPDVYREALRFKPTVNDVVVVTNPKSGTHWITQIALLILNRGQSPRDLADFVRQAPIIEYHGVPVSDVSPTLLRTHLSFGQLQYNKEAKYIYLARNPYNTCVSFYHHVKKLPGYRFQDGSFEDFVRAFVEGRVGQLDHMDHVLSGYERREEPNVLFLTYEKLKADTTRTVLKLVKFLVDQNATMLNQDSGLLDKILHKSSADYMQSIYDVSPKEFAVLYNHRPLSPEVEAEVKKRESGPGKYPIVRRGTTSERGSYFSPESLVLMQSWINNKTRGSDVMGLWEDE